MMLMIAVVPSLAWVRLYAASEGKLLERLQALPESVDSVMLIGHKPGLYKLARVLASRGADLPRLGEKFPTAHSPRSLSTARTGLLSGLAMQSSSITSFPRQLGLSSASAAAGKRND